jgi:hypothetical protein
MKMVRFVVAALMLLVGLVWIGQGMGVIGGSAMSGQAIWAVIGAVLVAGAAGVAWTGRSRRPA